MFIITNSKIVFTKFSKKASQSLVRNGNTHFSFLRKFFSSLFSHQPSWQENNGYQPSGLERREAEIGVFVERTALKVLKRKPSKTFKTRLSFESL